MGIYISSLKFQIVTSNSIQISDMDFKFKNLIFESYLLDVIHLFRISISKKLIDWCIKKLIYKNWNKKKTTY